MIRVVLDTNIIVSGTLWDRAPLEVLRRAEKRQFIALTSDELLEELRRTLNKDKIERVFANLGLRPEDIITAYQQVAITVEPVEIQPDAVRDVKDLPVLGCALGGKADVIVSGDKDLLSIGNYNNISVLTTAQFLGHHDLPPASSPDEPGAV